jgi:hypothetical protein
MFGLSFEDLFWWYNPNNDDTAVVVAASTSDEDSDEMLVDTTGDSDGDSMKSYGGWDYDDEEEEAFCIEDTITEGSRYFYPYFDSEVEDEGASYAVLDEDTGEEMSVEEHDRVCGCDLQAGI